MSSQIAVQCCHITADAICVNLCKYLYSCMKTEVSSPCRFLTIGLHHLMSVTVYLCLYLFLATFLCCNYQLMFSVSVGTFVNFRFNLKTDFCHNVKVSTRSQLQHGAISGKLL